MENTSPILSCGEASYLMEVRKCFYKFKSIFLIAVISYQNTSLGRHTYFPQKLGWMSIFEHTLSTICSFNNLVINMKLYFLVCPFCMSMIILEMHF